MMWSYPKLSAWVLLILASLHVTYSALVEKCDVKHSRGLVCSDICDAGNGSHPYLLSLPQSDPTSLQPCFTIDAFPMYKTERQVHVRVRPKIGDIRCATIASVPFAFALQAVDEEWEPIGKFAEGQDGKLLHGGSICSGEDNTIVNRHDLSHSNGEIYKTTRPCPSNPLANTLELRFNFKQIPEVNLKNPPLFCVLWNSSKTISKVKFLLQVVRDRQFEKSSNPADPAGPLYYSHFYESTWYYYNMEIELIQPTLSDVSCHDTGLLLGSTSFLTTSDIAVMSPKCRSETKYTDPCSDICAATVMGTYPRLKFNEGHHNCFKIKAFPMYKPHIQVHVQVRMANPCVSGSCCQDGNKMYVQAVNEDWEPLGKIKIPTTDELSASCKEDPNINDFIDKVGDPIDCEHSYSTAGGTKPTTVFIKFKNELANFCLVWECPKGLKTSIHVRFILEVAVTVGASQNVVQAYSDLYTFERFGKEDTNIKGCHDPLLLSEQGSHLRKYGDVQKPPETPTETEKPRTEDQVNKESEAERVKTQEKIDELNDTCDKTKRCISGQSPVCSTPEEVKSGKKKLKIDKGQSNCVKNKNCEFLLSYGQQTDNNQRVGADEILLQISGRSLHWIAVGFSDDDRMGDDFVVECVWYNSKMYVYTSWNSVGRTNTRMSEEEYTKFVRLIDGFIHQGKMYCSFALKKEVSYNKRSYNFDTSGYKTLMAVGISLGPNQTLTKHSPTGVSYSPVHSVFGETFGPNLYQEELMRYHGLMMWVAWMILVPISNLMARHYKETFLACQICGIKLWLIVHVILCTLALALTFLAHGVLTEANNSWHSLVDTFSDNINYHLWFSLACSSLYFFNIFVGCLIKETLRGEAKPGCLTCTWFHKWIGHGCYAIALASLYTSNETMYSHLPCSINYLMAAWIAIYHIGLFMIMEYHSLWVKWLLRVVAGKQQEQGVENPYDLFQDPALQHNAEAPLSKWRKWSLVVFCLIAFSFCARFIVISLDADEETACFRVDSLMPADKGDAITVEATCNPPSSE